MTESANFELAGIQSIPFKETPAYTAATFPKYALVREVDFEVRGGELWFFFSKWSKEKDLSQIDPDYKKAFGILVDSIIEGGYGFDYRAESVPKPKYASPLSLMVDKLSWVIYVLSSKSWQFGRVGRPITIADATNNIFFHAHRVPGSGFAQADMGTPFDNPGTPVDNCMLAFVIADGGTAGGGTTEYTHPINLHVDLIYGGPKRRHIPIMIDPDIRWPGGSQP